MSGDDEKKVEGQKRSSDELKAKLEDVLKRREERQVWNARGPDRPVLGFGRRRK